MVRSHVRPLMEVIKCGYQAEIVNALGTMFKAFSDTRDGIGSILGDKLSDLTLEEGVELPQGTEVKIYSAKKLGWIVFNKELIDSKTIV